MKTDPVVVYYDGDCPMCRWEVDKLQARVPGDRVKAVDIQALDFNKPDDVLDKDELMARLHVRTAEGELLTAMDASRAYYRACGLERFAALTEKPVFRPMFGIGYWLFARTRLPLGRWINRMIGYRPGQGRGTTKGDRHHD